MNVTRTESFVASYSESNTAHARDPYTYWYNKLDNANNSELVYLAHVNGRDHGIGSAARAVLASRVGFDTADNMIATEAAIWESERVAQLSLALQTN